MEVTLNEAVCLFNESGVFDHIRESAQLQRETERIKLMAKLREVRNSDEASGKQLASEIVCGTDNVARLEAELLDAKKNLNNLCSRKSLLGIQAEQLQGKIIQLADPRLDAAIMTLGDLSEKARQKFTSSEDRRRDTLTGKRRWTVIHNSEKILPIMAACTEGVAKLQLLKECRRPEGLQDVIDNIIKPIRDDVRTLLGV